MRKYQRERLAARRSDWLADKTCVVLGSRERLAAVLERRSRRSFRGMAANRAALLEYQR
jgi:hypothetical protein